MKYSALVALNIAVTSAANSFNSIILWFPIDGADLMEYCDVDESELQDGSGFSEDLTVAEINDCLTPNVPSKHLTRFERAINREWSYWDSNGDDALDNDEI